VRQGGPATARAEACEARAAATAPVRILRLLPPPRSHRKPCRGRAAMPRGQTVTAATAGFPTRAQTATLGRRHWTRRVREAGLRRARGRKPPRSLRRPRALRLAALRPVEASEPTRRAQRQ